ncbi:MAG: hypothetical protein H6962_04175 [Chromatiaceae bacterium]|nr:hypothetical protein [Chromatiaceae bacterium]
MRRVLIAVMCAMLSVLTACSSAPKPQAAPPTERQSLDRSARLAFAQGQYAQAATLYEAALEQALAEDAPAPLSIRDSTSRCARPTWVNMNRH